MALASVIKAVMKECCFCTRGYLVIPGRNDSKLDQVLCESCQLDAMKSEARMQWVTKTCGKFMSVLDSKEFLKNKKEKQHNRMNAEFGTLVYDEYDTEVRARYGL